MQQHTIAHDKQANQININMNMGIEALPSPITTLLLLLLVCDEAYVTKRTQCDNKMNTKQTESTAVKPTTL